jgi:lysophospholipase L1-like esterase
LINYKRIINDLAKRTHAVIYITNIPEFRHAKILPKTYRWFLEFQSAKLNPELLKLENDRVKVVNIHDFGWHNYPDIQKTFAADNFHPNDLGYENWTNAFLNKIRE